MISIRNISIFPLWKCIYEENMVIHINVTVLYSNCGCGWKAFKVGCLPVWKKFPRELVELTLFSSRRHRGSINLFYCSFKLDLPLFNFSTICYAFSARLGVLWCTMLVPNLNIYRFMSPSKKPVMALSSRQGTLTPMSLGFKMIFFDIPYTVSN